MSPDIFITAAGALCVGGVVGYLLAKVRTTALLGENATLRENLAAAERNHKLQSEQQRQLLEQKIEQQRLLMEQREEMFARNLAAQKETNREAMQAMQARFDTAIEKMKAEVEASTEGMLRKRRDELDSANREGIDKVLRPLGQTIDEMRKTVSENTSRHSEFGGQLTSAIKMVLEQSEAARKSADRLADALHGNTSAQGYWGETVLTELLEMQGLTKGVHFDTQVTMTDEAGHVLYNDKQQRLIPDVVLHLDRERDVIIDSKVSLTAYLDFLNATDEDQRNTALSAHVASIEAQVKKLVKTDYSAHQRGVAKTVDYVIMFVPNSSALYLACQAKPDLWRRAMEQKVYIADEQTLYAALKIIQLTWRQIAQADNHEKVFDLANEMLVRVGKFVEAYTALDKNLNDARKNFNTGLAKLQEGGQSIPGTCRKLIKLGATAYKPAKSLPGIDMDGRPEEDSNETD